MMQVLETMPRRRHSHFCMNCAHTPSNQRPGYNRMRRRHLAERFTTEKRGKAAKLSHHEAAGSAAAAAASAPKGAPLGASAASDTDDRRAKFGKGKHMPPPLPPADVDRDSLRSELMDRL
eukprot:2410516-Pleurochrysis_carterae.AAC.1